MATQYRALLVVLPKLWNSFPRQTLVSLSVAISEDFFVCLSSFIQSVLIFDFLFINCSNDVLFVAFKYLTLFCGF